MVSPNIVKKIPIAIGIKPNQPVTFTNKTIDFGSGTGNVITNIPNSGLQNNSININGVPVELGSNVNINQFSIEYSSDANAPTPVGAANGEFHFEGEVSGSDVDYVTFTTGAEVTALYLTYYESVDNVAFFAIMPGATWTAGQNTSLMTAFGHIGPSDVTTNVLGSATLAANTQYTLWVQQTGSDATKYVLSTDPSYLGNRASTNTDTTYTIESASVGSGARLDLVSGGTSVPTTDSVTFVGGGNLSVTSSGGNTITISDAGQLGGISITDSSVSTLTNKTISGSDNLISNLPNQSLQNSSITINDTVVSLGGSITISGGGSGSGDVTLNGAQTLTNKTLSGSNNTFSDIPNSALENSSISINGTPVALGTNFDVSGLGDVTLTGTQTLTNKSLYEPIVQDQRIVGAIYVGTGANADSGALNQVLKSNGNGSVSWENENQTTAQPLSIGTGLSGVGGSNFDGSNGVTITVDTSVTATLTGTQTLTNKTLEAPNLTGDLKVNGVSGSNGEVIVSDGAGGLTWGAGGSGGGGSGSFNGPATSTDNAIVRYDGTGGDTSQDSLVTIDDTGVITAPSVASLIPFYHSSSLSLPAASGVNGAVIVTANDNTLYYASNGVWNAVAKSADAVLQTRQTFSAQSSSIDSNTNAFPTINNAYKSWLLYKVQTDKAAWVTIYTSQAARNSDTTRTIDQDPMPGSGVIAEVITTGAQTQVMTPAVFGFNDESTVTDSIYMKVRNRSGSTGQVTVTLTLLKLEA